MNFYSVSMMGKLLKDTHCGDTLMQQLVRSKVATRFLPRDESLKTFDVHVQSDQKLVISGSIMIKGTALYIISYEAGKEAVTECLQRGHVLRLDPKTTEWKDWGMKPENAVMVWIAALLTESRREKTKADAIVEALRQASSHA